MAEKTKPSCEPQTMPVHCADAFAQLSVSISKLATVVERIDVQTLKTNGHVATLFQRAEASDRNIAILQEQVKVTTETRKTWGEWRRTITAGIIGAVIAGVIMLVITTLSG